MVPDSTFKTPILYLIFNRPDLVERTFQPVRKLRPKQLFIAADGPRPGNAKDILNVQTCKDLVLNTIDWDCDVRTLFRPENLSCGPAVSGAITWFFEQVPAGIIIEDDCLASGDFFRFCEMLLGQYQDEEQIMHISGSNFQNGKLRGSYSYYFSNYSHNWGWATWSKSWSRYSFHYSSEEVAKVVEQLNFSRMEKRFWIDCLSSYFDTEIESSWDYQWLFTLWKYDGISILPNYNLVKNIGFGDEATHTSSWDHEVPIKPLPIRGIQHPEDRKIHRKADLYASHHHFRIRPTLKNQMQALLSKARSIAR